MMLTRRLDEEEARVKDKDDVAQHLEENEPPLPIEDVIKVFCCSQDVVRVNEATKDGVNDSDEEDNAIRREVDSTLNEEDDSARLEERGEGCLFIFSSQDGKD
jgi:hypothetical protein